MKPVERTHQLLKRGWITHIECAARGGCYSLSQRAGELRRAGENILSKWVTTERGARIKAYRWAK